MGIVEFAQNKSNVYSFTVPRPGEIDWSRICQECAEDGHDAVVVTVRGADKATVILSEEFVAFNKQFADACINSIHLSNWRIGSEYYGYNGSTKFWFARDIDAADIGRTIQEIRAIKARTSPLKVNVHCVEAKRERDDLPWYAKRPEPKVKRVPAGTLPFGALCRCISDGPVLKLCGRNYIDHLMIACKFDDEYDNVELREDDDVIPVRAEFTNETE